MCRWIPADCRWQNRTESKTIKTGFEYPAASWWKYCPHRVSMQSSVTLSGLLKKARPCVKSLYVAGFVPCKTIMTNYFQVAGVKSAGYRESQQTSNENCEKLPKLRTRKTQTLQNRGNPCFSFREIEPQLWMPCARSQSP